MGMFDSLVQGSEEWRRWRKSGVGASYIPSLMGESDHYTPLQAYNILKGIAPDKDANFAMQRGMELEPKIRALYNLLTDRDLAPACVQHPDLKYFICSLDGYDPENGGHIAEFKAVGKDKHEEAVNGVVPKCYVGQVQAQLFTTGANTLDYVSYYDERIAIVRVVPDLNYWSRMLPVVESFWKCVETDTPPPMTDRDVLTLDESFSALSEMFTEWKTLKAIEPKSKRLDVLREEIVRLLPHPRVLCNGVQVFPTQRATGVTYTFKEVERGEAHAN